MKKCIRPIIKIIFVIVLIQIIFSPTSQANWWDDIFNKGEEFINTGKEELEKDATIDTEDVNKEYKKLFGILFALGVALSVIIGAILGIKFMVSGIEEQAKIKELLLPYVIGCIVIFGAFGIWKLAIELFSDVLA